MADTSHPISRRQAVVAALAAVSAMRAAAAGARGATVEDDTWQAGGRTVPVRVRWPAGTPPPGGWPVALFSHGLGGGRHGGAVWGEAWAAGRIVTVHLEHPASNRAAVRAADRVQAVAGGPQLLERLHDVRLALDAVQQRQSAGAGRWAQVRPHGFGLAGHSFGAATTLGAAGQAYPGLGTWNEPRLAAFIALSPALPAAGDAAAAYRGITRPMLCITGTEDGDVIGNGSTPERRRAVYDMLPPGHKALLVLHGADHMTFGGTPRAALPWRRRFDDAVRLEAAHQAVVAAITADWWASHLDGDPAARERLRSPAWLAARDLWRQG